MNLVPAHQPLQLSRELRQPLPVEGDSVAGSCWRQSHALVESERVLDIAVEPKAVRFEIGAIWAGREQVDGDVMCPVASYWKIERFCEPRDLHKGRYATAIGDVGLRISPAAIGTPPAAMMRA